jgi:SAM-dependent methyltransferase
MMERLSATETHSRELGNTFEIWQRKPLIRQVYQDFYWLIKGCLVEDLNSCTIELGSGFSGLKTIYSECVATDLFLTPWVDSVENAYQLSFAENSVRNVVMVDVFHHLEFPGDALKECFRVLAPGGRLLLLEPDLSCLGWLVYGLFHHEPLGLWNEIRWHRNASDSDCLRYYAAQANAHRIFLGREHGNELMGWSIVKTQRLAALSYVLSGGFRKRQLYPTVAYPIMKCFDSVLNCVPQVFSTRLFVVLQKEETVCNV